MSFYTLLTNIGLAKLTNAVSLGLNVEWTQMAVGDGNGNPTTPTQTQTQLVRERHRASINQLSVDPENPNHLIAELVIPTTVGGWTVHEVGVFDSDGDMVAVANFPATYKPVLTEGSGKDLVVRVIIEVSNAANVTLKIDPAVVLASRSWVETNFLRRSKVAGGTTGQVLRKTGNADEAFAWADPTMVNVTVNTVQELQTLAAAQTIVDWATITTVGAAYYVGGARLEPADFTVNSATRITLARSYPAGTKILGAINEPNGSDIEFVPISGGGNLTNATRRLITDSSTYILPATTTLEAGATLTVDKANGVNPTIQPGAGGAQIRTASGLLTSYLYQQNSQVSFIFDGANWLARPLMAEGAFGLGGVSVYKQSFNTAGDYTQFFTQSTPTNAMDGINLDGNWWHCLKFSSQDPSEATRPRGLLALKTHITGGFPINPQLWIAQLDFSGNPERFGRVYDTNSIVGAVSQTGGKPTGAIIQRGSNINGEFTRFADGSVDAFGGIVSSGGVQTWSFPTAFVAGVLSCTGNCTGGASFNCVVSFAPPGTTSVDLGLLSAHTNAFAIAGIPISLRAVGRWFSI